MAAPLVFMDIAGPDAGALRAFYSKVFDWEIGQDGQFLVDVKTSAPGAMELHGAIRQDPAEKVLYLGVPDIDASLALVMEHGGSIDQPRFEVSGVVILGLFNDPAGNRMGLVETENGEVKVP